MLNSDPLFPVLSEWLTRLADCGNRVTGKNRAILEVILQSEKALDPIAIFDRVREDYPGLGLVTVYRTLQKLEEIGLVERLHQPDGCHRVLRATRGHEHLLICRTCGRVVYFGGDDLQKLFENISGQTGFSIQTHWLQLFGTCPDCQTNPS